MKPVVQVILLVSFIFVSIVSLGAVIITRLFILQTDFTEKDATTTEATTSKLTTLETFTPTLRQAAAETGVLMAQWVIWAKNTQISENGENSGKWLKFLGKNILKKEKF